MASITRRIHRFQLSTSFAAFQNVRLLRLGGTVPTASTLFKNDRLTLHGSSQLTECCSIHTSSRHCKVLEVPSRKEAEALKRTYNDPRKLLHNLLEPVVQSGMTVEPKLVLAPKLCGQFWRAKLHLRWPSKVTISAVHSSITGAEENVYLLACDLFRNIGLLYEDSPGKIVPVSRDHVIQTLQTIHSANDPFAPQPKPFHFLTTPTALNTTHSSLCGTGDGVDQGCWVERHMWRTDVVVAQPYPFSVCAHGPSQEASQYAAALLTFMKLKAQGLLQNNNQLKWGRLQCLLSQICKKEVSSEPSEMRKTFDPHYEIYSDASAFGFGAYLLKRDDHRVHWFANTWAQHFPDSPEFQVKERLNAFSNKTKSSIQMDSTFCEFYSVVAACYTWKHKFEGKRVLVWTDNSGVVRLVNHGVQGEARQKRWGKLYCILSSTCKKYSFELRASHIQRTENVNADLLSRQYLAEFRKAVPEAAPSEKKAKKLLFWNPLQLNHLQPHLKSV